MRRPEGPKDRMAVLEVALSHVTDFRTAIDVGAHIGRWSKALSRRFERVIAFEPVLSNQEAWLKRLSGIENARLIGKAVGERNGKAVMDGPDKWKHRYAVPARRGDVEMVTIDSLKLKHCGFIKIDVEGGDAAVLKGASKTLKKHRPVVIVESVPEYEARYGFPAGAPIIFLKSLGYDLAETFWVDNILVFPRD